MKILNGGFGLLNGEKYYECQGVRNSLKLKILNQIKILKCFLIKNKF
jgi:hypothetical protein